MFETFTGASLEGEPVRLLYSKVTKPEVVMAVTKKDMVAVDPLSFTKLYSFDALFWTAPEVKAPGYYTAFYNKREMVINDGKVLRLITRRVVRTDRPFILVRLVTEDTGDWRIGVLQRHLIVLSCMMRFSNALNV